MKKASDYKIWLEELDKIFLREFFQPRRNFDDYNWFDEYDNDVSAEDAFAEWDAHTEHGTRSPNNF